MKRRDKYVVAAANLVLRAASRDYRRVLRTVIERELTRSTESKETS